MKITAVFADHTFNLEVPEDLELENFKAFCEVETGIPANEIVVFFNNLPLRDDKKTLGQYQIRDGDLVKLEGSSAACKLIS